jgi:hypothetical protein
MASWYKNFSKKLTFDDTSRHNFYSDTVQEEVLKVGPNAELFRGKQELCQSQPLSNTFFHLEIFKQAELSSEMFQQTGMSLEMFSAYWAEFRNVLQQNERNLEMFQQTELSFEMFFRRLSCV